MLTLPRQVLWNDPHSSCFGDDRQPESVVWDVGAADPKDDVETRLKARRGAERREKGFVASETPIPLIVPRSLTAALSHAPLPGVVDQRSVLAKQLARSRHLQVQVQGPQLLP